MQTFQLFPEPSNPEQYQTAPDKAYWTLYQKILTGELPAGEKLSLRKMAAFSKVSVIPVIEALHRLEKDGLVESRPKWGYFVAVPCLDALRNQFGLREAVECHVARVLNQNLSADKAKHLRKLARETDRMDLQRESESKVDDVHYQFHMTMAAYTDLQSLVDALRRINLFFLLSKITSQDQRSTFPPGWHQKLLDGILKGTPEEAEAAMREHVLLGYERFVGLFR